MAEFNPQPNIDESVDDDDYESIVEQLNKKLHITDTKKTFFQSEKRRRGEVKHAVLQYYLGGFFPILSSDAANCNEIIYIDGFSGPGFYQIKDEEDEQAGSPLVVCKLIMDHKLKHKFTRPIRLIFVEMEKKYVKQLTKKLNQLMVGQMSESVSIEVHHSDFQIVMNEVLETIDERSALFVFADPFGYKGVPMELLQRIVQRPYKTELFLNVMYHAGRRWFKSRLHQKPISSWLGMEESQWKNIVFAKENGNDPSKVRKSFMELYMKRLTRTAIPDKYSLKFSMRSAGNVNIYNLIFITGHLKGFKLMKTAMYKYSQSSNTYEFSEWLENKGDVLPKKQKNEIKEELVEIIKKEFAGETVQGKDIDEFVWLKTPYVMNFKIEFKTEFKDYLEYEPETKKFDDWLFTFPR